MGYKRKTADEYEVHGLYSMGWEAVTVEDNRSQARERLKEYRENELGTAFKIVKRRVKIEKP